VAVGFQKSKPLFCLKFFRFQKVFFTSTLSTLSISRNCLWMDYRLAAKTAVFIGIRLSCCLAAASFCIGLPDKAPLFAVAVGWLEVVSYILGGILSYWRISDWVLGTRHYAPGRTNLCCNF
jgi:hypothetical protein